MAMAFCSGLFLPGLLAWLLPLLVLAASDIALSLLSVTRLRGRAIRGLGLSRDCGRLGLMALRGSGTGTRRSDCYYSKRVDFLCGDQCHFLALDPFIRGAGGLVQASRPVCPVIPDGIFRNAPMDFVCGTDFCGSTFGDLFECTRRGATR
jgi:hypothetical protein